MESTESNGPISKRLIDSLTYKIIGAAIDVHKRLGTGLLESVYHKCMLQELSLRKLAFATELYAPVEYKGIEVAAELRCDFLVEQLIVVELKAVEEIAPVHTAQLLTYMKLLKAPKGILLNFHCTNIFRDGQRTFVTKDYQDLPDGWAFTKVVTYVLKS